MYQAAPINAWFKPVLTVAKGKAEIRIPLRDEFHHSAGATHGTLYFKALDDATFFAANSLVEDVFVLTARFELQLLAPVVSGEIIARAEVVKQDSRRITADGELYDAEDNLIAVGQGHFARSKIALGPEVKYR